MFSSRACALFPHVAPVMRKQATTHAFNVACIVFVLAAFRCHEVTRLPLGPDVAFFLGAVTCQSALCKAGSYAAKQNVPLTQVRTRGLGLIAFFPLQ